MTRSSQTPYMGILLLILIVKAVLLTLLIVEGPLGLSPDEAQYWTWSQQLDWGYYSKPPAIAWQIWVGTVFFGNSLLGVRFISIILGLLQPLLLYALARCCNLQIRTAFWAAIMLALTPLGVFSSILAITDVGMVTFWICATIVITHALEKDHKPNYYLFGLCILLGALFKWPIFLLWGVVVGMIPMYPTLKSRSLFAGIGISLLALIPSFTWNVQHNWVTIRHVAQSLTQGSPSEKTSSLFAGNFWSFFGAQAGLLSPILFILLIVSFWTLFRKRKEIPNAVAFCGFSSFFLIGLMTCMSIFKKVQGNWCDFAYPTALVFLAWFAFESTSWAKRWVRAGVLLSVVLILSTFSIPFIQSQGLFPQAEISYKINPFRHMLGWNKLDKELINAGYDSNKDFLFSSKYQMSSILSFYGPSQKRAYFFNIFGVRKNQFSFWPQMSDEQVGKDGFFVIAENSPSLEKHLQELNSYVDELNPYFESVEFIGVKPLFSSYGKMSKGALIFKCKNYLGQAPESPEKY